jgi:threonine aldolase
VALQTMVTRLSEDHATARRLAEGLQRLSPALAEARSVETNIVNADVSSSGRLAAEWSSELRKRGVGVSPGDRQTLRFVTHRHIGNVEVDEAVSAFEAAWKAFARASK